MNEKSKASAITVKVIRRFLLHITNTKNIIAARKRKSMVNIFTLLSRQKPTIPDAKKQKQQSINGLRLKIPIISSPFDTSAHYYTMLFRLMQYLTTNKFFEIFWDIFIISLTSVQFFYIMVKITLNLSDIFW